MPAEIEPTKLELTRKQDQELKIFFMIGRKLAPDKKIDEEKIIAILAYILEDAFEMARKDYSGYSLGYNGQFMAVKELLDRVQEKGAIIPGSIEKSGPIKKMGRDQFKNNLMLAMDEFVKGRDKATLKRIIKSIEV